ncbi:pleckstrin homology-like domain-containing protein [Osmerus mordax]|uniref:pleckstrin homology-like domain-containing protein n=1 Tax=Osmerus mordax TaxID=8014 RepID=UPI00350F3544
MMAVESATSNGADENSKLKEDKKGWLSKRTHFTHRWKTTWFQLKDTQLLYGQNEGKPVKSIDIVGAVVETDEGGGSYGWTITPKDRSRTFYLRAESVVDQQGWMLAVCEAQLTSTEHASNACVLQ